MDAPGRAGYLPPLTTEAQGRLNLLLDGGITLVGQTERIDLIQTTVREILAVLSSLLPQPNELSLYGSSVMYLVDGDRKYSEVCFDTAGGFRPRPHDFDLAVTTPEADFYLRRRAYDQFVSWVAKEMLLSKPEHFKDRRPEVVQSVVNNLLTGGGRYVWNCSDPQAINRFLFFSLRAKTAANKLWRLDIRLTEALGLPHLFSTERLKILFNPTRLTPDSPEGLQCVEHWNRGVACLDQPGKMDPMAWVKMVLKIARGSTFSDTDIKCLTERAIDPDLGRTRKILSPDELVQRGIDPEDPLKALHFTFHAYRLLLPYPNFQGSVRLPQLNREPGIANELCRWIEKNAFGSKQRFEKALDKLSLYVSAASLFYREGLKELTFKQIGSNILVRTGTKQSSLFFHVPRVNPFERPLDCLELGAIFSLYPSSLTPELKSLWFLEELSTCGDDASFLATYKSGVIPHDKVSKEICQRLLTIKEASSCLVPLYPKYRATEMRKAFLESMAHIPYPASLFQDTALTLYPDELEYLARRFNETHAQAILSLVQQKGILRDFLNGLKLDFSSAEAFAKSLYLARTKVKRWDLPAFNGDDVAVEGLSADPPEALAFYYERVQPKTLNEEFSHIFRSLQLFEGVPHAREWLKKIVIAFIEKDIDDNEVYFEFWNRMIPYLVGRMSPLFRKEVVPEENSERLISLSSALLKGSRARHLIRFFSLLGNVKSRPLLEIQYMRNLVEEAVRHAGLIEEEGSEKRYAYEAALDAFKRYIALKVKPPALKAYWDRLDKEIPDKDAGAKVLAFEYLILEMKFVSVIKPAESNENLYPYLLIISEHLTDYLPRFDATSFRVLHAHFKSLWDRDMLKGAPPILLLNIKMIERHFQELDRSCAII